MKKIITLSFLGITAFIAGCLFFQSNHTFSYFNMPSMLSAANEAHHPSELKSFMIWASTVASIPELTADADLIVRTRVIRDPESRIETFIGPIWSEEGKIIGHVNYKFVFSDTQMQVVDVYKGEPTTRITVMQTGGTTQRLSTSSVQAFIEDDPLYLVGEESVLFLVDISGDPIHAHGRTLYRIINPASRYTINGFEVRNYAESSLSNNNPKTLDDLISQIQKALK